VSDDLALLLAEGRYDDVAVGVFIGFALALFAALMWLRVWRWLFALLGLRA
jgi:hypothetical protein